MLRPARVRNWAGMRRCSGSRIRFLPILRARFPVCISSSDCCPAHTSQCRVASSRATPSAEEPRISRNLLRPRPALSLHLLDHRHQRGVVGRVLRHPRGHDQVIVADDQIRRLAQLPALRRTQEAAVRIGQRNLGSSLLGQRRNGLLGQRPWLLRLRLTPPSSSGSCGLAFCWNDRTSRRSRAHCSRRACSQSTTLRREAFARTRVESIATCPNFPSPARRAICTTWVNTSLIARRCRRKNSLSVL